MNLVTLSDLLVLKIKALYDIEQELVKALPEMAQKATDPDLKSIFKTHLNETKIHIKRLEEIFNLLGVKPAKIQVEGIRGLVADAEWGMKNIETPEALDANLIAGAQCIEHYEMIRYCTAGEWAVILDLPKVVKILEKTSDEETASNAKLSALAMGGINEKAAMIMIDEE